MNTLLLHALIEKEGDRYTALCLELNVATFGDTVEEANVNLREAVELYLEDVMEAGDEIDFLPRPAPQEEWLKFFHAEFQRMREQLRRRVSPKDISIGEVLYA
jgi:predicted RNase H-like HicB family nuclease